MIRIIDGKEVMIICLNEECDCWCSRRIYFCEKYTTTSEIIDCPNNVLKTGVTVLVKP